MISPFGIFSLIASAISVTALIFVFQVLKRRSAVDDAYAALDNISRGQLEIIYDAAADLPQRDDIREMCESFAGYELRVLYRKLPDLRAGLPENDALADSVSRGHAAAHALNMKIEEYNTFAQKIPARFILPVLGLRAEKNV